LRQLRSGPGRRRAAFESIYARNAWGSDESVSGLGSEIEFTSGLRAALAEHLRRLGVRSMVDAPCGDFNWMSQVDLAGVRYLGVDIVSDLIESNRKRHGRDGVEFRILDIVAEQIPRADLVLCRHCLIHLSNRDVRKAISNFRRSGSTWLLTTHSQSVARNEDIESGSFRPINLQMSPFNLPPPEQMIRDEPASTGPATGFLGLWRLADLARAGY
jgi:hypothetical protein